MPHPSSGLPKGLCPTRERSLPTPRGRPRIVWRAPTRFPRWGSVDPIPLAIVAELVQRLREAGKS